MSDNYVGRSPGQATAFIENPAGRLVQSLAHVRGDFLSTAAVIPTDNTIPQITEGTEWFTVTITPLYIGSTIRVRAVAHCGGTAGLAGMCALFRAPGPDAVAVGWQGIAAAGQVGAIQADYSFISASLAPIVFSARYGVSAGNLQLNGSGSAFMGGAFASFLRVEEFAAPALLPVATNTASAPGTLVGYTMSNNAIDAVNDIDVAPGKCRASLDLGDIVLQGIFTKQLDAVWAPGTNAGMRASGAAIADGTYHIFAIKRPDTGQVDIAADTDVLGANIPANTVGAYTQRRRIGSIMRVAGSIVGFVQDGDLFQRKATAPDVAVNNPGVAAVTRTLSVPLGLPLRAILSLSVNAAGAVLRGGWYISDLAVTDEVAALGNSQVSGGMSIAGTNFDAAETVVRTNALAQVRSRAASSDGNVSYNIVTRGWFDRRGRDDV